MTLDSLIDAWLADRAAEGCSAGTLRVYRSRTRSLRVAFGERACPDITRMELLIWRDAESHFPDGRQKKANTRCLILTVLGMLQEFAIDREVLTYPWVRPKDLKKPKRQRRERLPTPEETQMILEAADAEYAVFYQTLRLTGARPGELCAAKIEQIITSGGRRTLVLTDHKTARKTGRSRRIPIGAEVASVVERAIDNRSSGPVFLRADGTPWAVSATTAYFRALRRRLGLDEVLVQYLCRHEFGTRAVKKLGIKRAADLLGHASITTTQIYDHPDDAEIHEAQGGLFD